MLTTATETLELTLTLTKQVADHLRDEVAHGPYASPNEFVEAILESNTLFDPISASELVEWANTEGLRRLNVLESDPSSGMTATQAFAGLIGDE